MNEFERLKAQMQSILDGAKAQNRDLNDSEVRTLDELHPRAVAAKEALERGAKANALVASLTGGGYTGRSIPLPEGDENSHSGAAQRLSFRGSKAGASVATKAEQRGGGIKGVLDAGSVSTVAVEVLDGPVPTGRPALSVLDLLPAVEVGNNGQISYMQQSVRVNNAAPVAPGAQKPVSDFKVKRVNDELQVVAHLADNLSKYDLSDSPALARFVSDELMWGLGQALEGQVINGTGVKPSLNGILTTSGVRQQAYQTSAVVTVRRAMGQLEAAGYEVDGIMLNPADWLAIETTQTTDGGFLLGVGSVGAPIDAVERRLWGTRVALSNQLAAGTAIVLSRQSVVLFYDRDVMIELDPFTGFSTNTLRARAEVRAQSAILRPSGIAVADLTA